MNLNRAVRLIAAGAIALAIAAMAARDVKADATVYYGLGGWWRGVQRWNFPDIDPSGPSWDVLNTVTNPVQSRATPVVLFTADPATLTGFPYVNIISRQGQGRGPVPPRPAVETVCDECTPPNGVPECLDHVIMSVGIENQGFAALPHGPAAYAFPIGIGLPTAGSPLQVSARDSASARDSISFRVSRVGGVVTLSNFKGFLRNNPRTIVGGRHVRSSLYIGVYPDSFAAIADSDNRGNNASWHARVDLRPVDQPHLALSGKPGHTFDTGDFTLSEPGDGTQLATPSATMSHNIDLADSTIAKAAVVKVVVDPQVIYAGLAPGISPVGMVAVSAGMLLAGLWVMMRRRRNLA